MAGLNVITITTVNDVQPVITLYTIGHSNHSIENFATLLINAGVQILIDIRTTPSSRHNPQFNQPALREALDTLGIVYHMAGRQLGGKRPAGVDSQHIALDEDLRGFAEYMQTAHFERAAAQLVNLAGKDKTVMMCAEADPVYCHRRLIADYLLLQGHTVVHLLPDGTEQEHLLSTEARRESAELIYDRNITSELPL